MVEYTIKMTNLEYKKHYFFYKNEQTELQYNIKSFDDYFYLIHKHTNKIEYDLFNYDVLDKYIMIKTMKCRHLFHDDSWIKVTSKNKNFINNIEELEELNEIDNDTIVFINSINTDDISNINFLQFVNDINNSTFGLYSIELKYIDFDEDTENVKWIVINCKKNEN